MQSYNHRQPLDWLNIEKKASVVTPCLKMRSVFQRIRHTLSKNLVIIDLRLELPVMIDRSSLYSENFSAAGTDTWYLQLKPSNCNHMYLNLCNDSTHRYKVMFLRFTTAVFSLEEEKVLYSWDSGAYIILPTDIPFDLLQWSMKRFQVVNCPIRITCWLEISNVQKSFVPSVLKHDINAFESLRSVADDLKVGLCNPVDTDVTFQIKGISIIKAHKYILRMRSPVFNNMIAQFTSRDIVIDIKDISALAMTELVSYIYTGSKNVLGFRDTMDLYYASGKYEIKCLKDDCRNDLLCHLQIDNVCNLFVFAYQHNDVFLEDEIVSFLNNNFEDVVNTKSFEQLSRSNNIVQSLLRKHFQNYPKY